MIGAGGVATVAAFKIAQNADVFTEFMIASRRKAKCDKIVEDIHKAGYKLDIKTAQVDADDVEQLKALFNDYKPELVINLALPYQDLTIMDACLACGCNYLDTANYEPKDEAHYDEVRSILRKMDDDEKRITVFAMQPMAGGNFRQEILGYSLMAALGIKGEEIK